MNLRYALLLVVLIWGMSPVVVHGFGGLLPPLQAASAVILCATAFVTLCLMLFRRATFRELWMARASIQANFPFLICAAVLAFVAYPFFYFSGIQSPSPVEANIVNYTWPLIAVAVSLLMKTERFSLERGVSLLLGFGGALLASRSVSGLTTIFATAPTELKGLSPLNGGISSAVAFAFLGAVSYGTYSGLIKKIHGLVSALSSVGLYYLLLVTASLIHVVLFLPLVVTPVQMPVHFSVSSAALLLIYACVNLAAGHLLWLYVVAQRRVYESAVTVYLVPVVSTFALSFLGGFEITDGVLTGLTMIVMARYLGQYQQVAVPPLLATLFAVLLAWLMSLAFPAAPEAASGALTATNLYLGMLEVLVAIFGIFSGFILTRVIGQYVQSHGTVLKMFDYLSQLQRSTLGNVSLVQRVEELRVAVLDEYGLWIECGPAVSFVEARGKIRDLLVELDEVGNVGPARVALEQVKSELRAWRFSQQQAVTAFEWFILIATSITLMLLAYNTQWPTLTFIIGRVVLVAAVLLVVLAIREYNSNRPMKAASFLVDAQMGFSANESVPYLPRCIMDYVEFGKLDLRGLSEIRTRDAQTGMVKLCPVPKNQPLTSWNVHFLALLVFGLVVFTTIRNLLLH